MRGDDSWQVDGAAWLFNAFVLLAGCAYLVGGIAMGKRAGAKPAGPAGGVRILAAARLHPHWAVWEQTAGLAKDGVLFTLARSGVRLGSGMHSLSREPTLPLAARTLRGRDHERAVPTLEAVRGEVFRALERVHLWLTPRTH